GLAVHTARAQVADLAGAQLADAAVADAHATAEGHLRAGLLSREEDRLLAVGRRVDPAAREADRAAATALALADAALGLEVLGVQALGETLLSPVLAKRLQQAGGSAEERLAVAPVGADRLQLARVEAT